MKFVVDILALGQVFVILPPFYPVIVIPPMAYTHIHLSVILGQAVEAWET